MRFIDGQFKEIAKEAGLSDLKNDPKANLSVLEVARRKQELANQQMMPRWGPVSHAAPGFSREKNPTIPVVSSTTFGTKESSISKFYESPPPPPRPHFVGKPRD
jgi:hypothetical protein